MPREVVVTEGGSEGTSALLSAPAVPCSTAVTSKKGQRQACGPPCQPMFMSGQCPKVEGGWAAVGLGDTPVGGQLTSRSVALLAEMPQLGLHFRSAFFLIFKMGCLLSLILSLLFYEDKG